MKVKVLKDFYDLKANRLLRKKGDEYETDAGRATELKSGGFVKPIAEPKPESEEKPEQAEPKQAKDEKPEKQPEQSEEKPKRGRKPKNQ